MQDFIPVLDICTLIDQYSRSIPLFLKEINYDVEQMRSLTMHNVNNFKVPIMNSKQEIVDTVTGSIPASIWTLLPTQRRQRMAIARVFRRQYHFEVGLFASTVLIAIRVYEYVFIFGCVWSSVKQCLV